MSIYKDFVGLNYGVYDPSGEDSGSAGTNHLGYDLSGPYLYSDSTGPHISAPVTHNSYQTLSLLNLHRNGPYGYPMWKQIRASDNHLFRRYRLDNTFTYVQQPGAFFGDRQDKYGEIVKLKEPVVSENYPISLIGEVSVYNEELGIFEKKPVEIKTAFNNETTFFVNKQANENFSTILETDDNYEALKEMYLDGGLEDEGSMLDAFSLLTYRQTIWPKQQYAYLDQTRSRTFYVNTFWRDLREDRTQTDVDNGFGTVIPSQSMWPLDAADDFETRTTPTKTISTLPDKSFIDYRIGGNGNTTPYNNTDGGEGVLQNSYSHVFPGVYLSSSTHMDIPVTASDSGDPDPSTFLTASIFYSRRHTLTSLASVVSPSGINIKERDFDFFNHPDLNPAAATIPTASLFEGVANWDAPQQSGKNPFYDSYSDYSMELKTKGKGFSLIPEFKISSHVETYETIGVTEELVSIFELSGVLSQNTNTSNESEFYKIISNSDFMKHFDVIKKDHENFAKESILTLKCKALKKFLPYEGFYPASRTYDLGKQFVRSYGDNIVSFDSTKVNSSDLSAIPASFRLQPVLEPLFAPGILFNTIKSGVAVDYPIIKFDYEFGGSDENGGIYTSSANDSNTTYQFGIGTPPFLNYTTKYSGFSSASSDSTVSSIFSNRIPFEALVEPEDFIANLEMQIQEPHPFGYRESSIVSKWTGEGDILYKKMAHNLLAEISDLFIEGSAPKTISSLEEQNPNFGNAIAGRYYVMRLKMKKTRKNPNKTLTGYSSEQVTPPQDLTTYFDLFTGTTNIKEIPLEGGSGTGGKHRYNTKESLTMYSRPSAFGPPIFGGGGKGEHNGVEFRECDSFWGINHPYTPPYYHGEAWCDIIFRADETKKYTLDEILSGSQRFPYYTRHWWNGTMDALRDVSGYSGSSNVSSSFEIIEGPYSEYSDSYWLELIRSTRPNLEIKDWGGSSAAGSIVVPFTGEQWGKFSGANGISFASSGNDLAWRTRPIRNSAIGISDSDVSGQHPFYINYNAMQLDSSVNIFSKGTVRKVFDNETEKVSEVASSDTIKGKTRWIIQPKFETPILNFNKYERLSDHGCATPLYASESVPRGMWHQYGDIPEDPKVGVFLQIEDIPNSWLRGAIGIKNPRKNIDSLADLVGFSKEPVRLGEVATQKEISECVVAVPFIEKDGTRKFFSIPRADIDSCISAAKREIDGNFPAGGPPKAGDSVYQMVKKMQKYVFPPSMDFVRYEEIDPFAMYIFEFKHTLSKQDLADIWQNLPPEIGTKMEEAEASISHELLAAELLGDGAVVKNNVLDENAEGKGIPSNIQWMVFKVKKRAKTNYFDKIVAKKGTTEDTSGIQLEGVTNSIDGSRDKEITYNWPYDFFSLVELVKIDAEVSFANIENDDKGQKSIKKVESKKTRDPSMINKARGKGRIE